MGRLLRLGGPLLPRLPKKGYVANAPPVAKHCAPAACHSDGVASLASPVGETKKAPC